VVGEKRHRVVAVMNRAAVGRCLAGLVLASFLVVDPIGAGEISAGTSAPGQTCMWRVSSGTTVMYLLGSVHLLRSDDAFLSSDIERAFEQSEIVVFEVNFEAEDTAGAALRMMEASVLPEQKSLRDVVSPETYRMVERRFESMGLDVATMQQMRPWMVATTMALEELQRAGYSPTHGVDRSLYRRASESGLEIRGLETIQDQLSLFENMTPAQDEAFLVQTMKDLDTVIGMADEIVEMWRSGRTDELGAVLADGYDDFPELFARLVSERNRKWMPKLEELLAGTEGVFVVVGALHLVGDEGVIALLRQGGYTVEHL